MDIKNNDTPDYFPELSCKVRDLIARVREALFHADDQLCLRLMAECSALMAEVELQDAVLSILRDDERLAYGVRKKDEELDQLYATEMERIFHNTSSAMFYNFQTGTCLLFILRAIERIGDHAKELAIPSFYLLTAGGRSVDEKRCAI